MSITTTIAALQTLHAAISGITSAPTAYPASLPTASLPLALVWLGEGDWQRNTASAPLAHWQTYRVLVYVDAVGQGQGVDEVRQTLHTLYQRFGEAYMNTNNVILTSGTYSASLLTGAGDVRSMGDQTLIYPPGPGGTQYYGFEFDIRVKETS